VATQPEAQRLFEPGSLDGTHPSQGQTEPSVTDRDTAVPGSTQREPSRTATTRSVSATKPIARHSVDQGDRAELLRSASTEATLVRTATEALADALRAARAAGCSWREIGIATGIPYQTLHRRDRRGGISRHRGGATA